MEFLPEGGGRAPPSSNTKGSSGEGAASARPQLLAIGDESGTLHVVDMPRTVVRPVRIGVMVIDVGGYISVIVVVIFHIYWCTMKP